MLCVSVYNHNFNYNFTFYRVSSSSTRMLNTITGIFHVYTKSASLQQRQTTEYKQKTHIHTKPSIHTNTNYSL